MLVGWAGASAGVAGVVFGQGVCFLVRRERKTAMVWSSVVDGWCMRCDDCEGCGGTRVGHTGTRLQKKTANICARTPYVTVPENEKVMTSC